MNNELRSRIIRWALTHPKFKKYIGNYEVLLHLYAKHHPEENIIPDFELERPIINISGQTWSPDYKNKVFSFTLNKLGHTKRPPRSWKQNSPYIGQNDKILRLAIENGFSIEVICNETVFLIYPEVIQKALNSNWKISDTKSGLDLIGIPIYETPRKAVISKPNRKLSDFVN